MRSNPRVSTPYIVTVLTVTLFIMTGCAPSNQIEGRSASGQMTTISVSGAFALYSLMTIWAEEYQQVNPDVRFDMQAGGAGKGMSDVLAGAADIAMLSREVRPEESERGAFLVPVTIDAVVATVNANNPALDQLLATGITPESGAAIWLTDEIATWGALVGSDNPSLINIYTRSDASGAAEVWAKYLGGESQEELRGTGVNGDPGIAEAIRQDQLGIGYNNIAFAYDMTTGLQVEGIRAVPFDLNGDGQITPDEDFYATREDVTRAISEGIYPRPPARVLYLVTKGKPNPVITEFYRWVLTEGQVFAKEAGYVALSATQIQEALALLD